ncbi:DUF4352 domain-containing protein [Nonomuraea sp. NBC_01738]|uniref:hypothetical protein n=1 Tax=Nonomuraea sp. NBC_01738 TaxID=2976003 RepID=UPI002E10C36F|nr:DUF4352 domain-containing protein [Nonomuraea sp. NBC_01738]
MSGCLIAAAVALVVLVVLVALLMWVFRSPPAVGDDSPVQDGRLTFALTGTKCPKPAKEALVRSCRLTVKIDNVGPEARVLYPGQQKLLDEDDALHGGTKLFDAAGKEITPIRIEPGGSFAGAVEFELPRTAKPAGFELHDSGLSRGVRVMLS